MKEVQEMDNEKTLESVPSATQEKIKVESINVIVEEIGGKPYYELRYRVDEQNVPEAPDPVYGREYQEKNSKIF